MAPSQLFCHQEKLREEENWLAGKGRNGLFIWLLFRRDLLLQTEANGDTEKTTEKHKD